ncbi:nucleotidyltransferase domain-containing protein [Paractinoplanes toevensis]|uniref:Polymerase nucleotidyl transferase domain-containing protein n=1 Tax=Paractinoplanes toevensis TaxID=571911 RepID=A0A919W2A1_9ACTN|nr:nucleotidyltransferase domain-containing protein [Actinoplanes toevensis]GIM89300.1 hypothetical protein Ato02nite_010930 [Actinoplanes toevensis]
MSTAAAVQKLQQAKEASDALASVPEVAGVVLFGSVARGRASRDSDIDLLILVTADDLEITDLRHHLPISLREVPISLSSHTSDGLAAYIRRWSRFGAHLRQEGKILHDTGDQLRTLLSDEVPISVESELDTQQHHLQTYKHVERFGGRFLFPLAHLHRIGRATAYALLAKEGVLEFDGKSAFQELLARHPTWTEDINVIMSLGPFYKRVRIDSSDIELPFDPTGPEAERKLVEAREAISRLLERSRELP